MSAAYCSLKLFILGLNNLKGGERNLAVAIFKSRCAHAGQHNSPMLTAKVAMKL